MKNYMKNITKYVKNMKRKFCNSFIKNVKMSMIRQQNINNMKTG